MIAVVLAAGMSSRLRPLTDTVPKSLLPVGGTPLLHRTLEALRHSGIRDCLIVTGYHHERIEHSLQKVKASLNVRFVFNPLFASTNNNYSLWLAHPYMAGQEMLLLDADILFHEKILERLLRAPYENALVLRHSRDLGPEEIKVELTSHGRVLHIGKTVDSTCAAGESLGIEKFSPAVTEQLFGVLHRRKDKDEFYEVAFQEVIDRGAAIFAVDDGGFPCIEIDTEEDLRTAERLARLMFS